MHCSYCGKKIPDGSKFCIACGEKIINKEIFAKSGNATIEDSVNSDKDIKKIKFEPNKHKTEGIYCKKCGKELKIGDLFCVNCGTPIGITNDLNGNRSGSNDVGENKIQDDDSNLKERKNNKNKKRILILVICALAVVLIAVGLGFSKGKFLKNQGDSDENVIQDDSSDQIEDMEEEKELLEEASAVEEEEEPIDEGTLEDSEPFENKGSDLGTDASGNEVSDSDAEASDSEASDNGVAESESSGNESSGSSSSTVGITQNVCEPELNDSEYQYLIKNVSGSLNVRAKPSYDSDLVYQITNEEMIYEGKWDTGLGSDGKMHYWLYVSNGFSGWVRSDLVITEGIYYTKGSNSSINLRSEPNHSSSLVYTVKDNTPMYFYGEVESGYGSDNVLHDWFKVYIGDGISGWVRSDLVVSGE